MIQHKRSPEGIAQEEAEQARRHTKLLALVAAAGSQCAYAEQIGVKQGSIGGRITRAQRIPKRIIGE